MLLSHLLEDVEIYSKYRDVEINFITDELSRVHENSLFVCIEGKKTDGHSYALEAQKKGACAVITERDLGLDNQIIVPDSKKMLSYLSAKYFGNPQEELKLIGVTGTNGKTSVCFMIEHIFRMNSINTGVIGTVYNQTGGRCLSPTLTTPKPFEMFSLMREMVDSSCEYCVMEVSSQAIAQGRINELHFDCAVFTNITVDHLDYHETFETYLNEKLKLFKACEVTLANFDDKTFVDVKKYSKGKVLSFSNSSNEADFTAKNINLNADNVVYDLVCKGKIGRVKLNFPAEFFVSNSMAAIGAAMCQGISFENCVNAMNQFDGVKGRMERVDNGRDYTVLIDYAHSPDGLENILSSLDRVKPARLITVFGCGGDRDKSKRPMMGKIAQKYSDIVIVSSDNPRTENPREIIEDILHGMDLKSSQILIEPDRITAIKLALEIAKKNDIVVLAGKGHETYQILGTKKVFLDERKIVLES